MTRFLLALERESFNGLAYLVVGEEKHTIRAQVKSRLIEHIVQALDEFGYAFAPYVSGIVCVDPRAPSS